MAQGKNSSKRFNIEQFLCSSNCNVRTASEYAFVSGTGEVAELLREISGYGGEIDIMDASMGMLYLASKKNIGTR